MDQVDAAIASLRGGSLAALPTETVYGLAADASSERAVAAVFAAKGRPRFDPLIVHVADRAMVADHAGFDSRAEDMARRFWPGPLTMVLPRGRGIADLATSGLDTVAVRCPAHPLARRVIAGCGFPLAMPSANRFGRISPTRAEDVRAQFPDADFPIVDGGPCAVGLESTVVALTGVPRVLRPGAVTPEELAGVLGGPVPIVGDRERGDSIRAPGMLPRHYAPGRPLRLRRPGEPWPGDPRRALLAFGGEDLPPGHPRVAVLSSERDLATAATRLFAALRELDREGVDEIVAETVPDEGLGLAINDRLRRAAGDGGV